MKTNVVAKSNMGGLSRAVTPDFETGETEQWQKRYALRFYAAHVESGTRMSLDMQNLKVSRGRKFTEQVAPRISSQNNIWTYAKRGVFQEARRIPDHIIAKLDALDQEIERLGKDKQDIIRGAYDIGVPIRLAEAESWVKEKA